MRSAVLTFCFLLGACVSQGPSGELAVDTDGGTRSRTQPELCRPCQTDDQCGGNGAYCVSDPSGGGACGTACQAALDCPDGFSCYALTDPNKRPLGSVCLPASNASCFDARPDAGSSNPVPDAGIANPAPDAGASSAFSSCTQDTWANPTQAFFSSNCTRCHPMYSGLAGVQADATRIKADLGSRRMPSDHALSDQDIARISRWLDCDLPP